MTTAVRLFPLFAVVATACFTTTPRAVTKSVAPAIARSALAPRPQSPLPQDVPTSLSLPVSDAPRVPFPEDALRVNLTPRELVIGTPPRLRLPLPDLQTMASTGFGVPYKIGPNDLKVAPVDNFLKELNPHQQRTAVIFADSSTTYRVLIELLFTLSTNDCNFWILATRPRAPISDGTHGWTTSVPIKLGNGITSVLLQSDAYLLRVENQFVGPGCALQTAGTAVFRQPGLLANADITSCLSSLRPLIRERSLAVSADPDLFLVSADRGITYREAIAAIDAVHKAGFDKFAFKLWR